MRGWTVDVIVGWIVGSIAVGTVFSLVAYYMDASDADELRAAQLGVLLGTAVGIVLMRGRRHARETKPSQADHSVAGWHADPWGVADYRYFDGESWTGYTSGSSVAAASSRPSPPHTSPSLDLAAVEARLSQLQQLLDGGAITSDEHATRRAEILREL